MCLMLELLCTHCLENAFNPLPDVPGLCVRAAVGGPGVRPSVRVPVLSESGVRASSEHSPASPPPLSPRGRGFGPSHAPWSSRIQVPATSSYLLTLCPLPSRLPTAACFSLKRHFKWQHLGTACLSFSPW